ncbi:unnamed protein product [Cuscuta campestris]|uniref:Uncharacterized protein n=1 Tax=Cuscuta campestris TaxID=132261 RepID=A0A484KUR6_9ASTE|nr:unnamed protein product [Cuscuta campestris]
MNDSKCTVSCISLEDRLANLDVIGSRALHVLRKTLHPATCNAPRRDSESKFVKTFEEDQIPPFGVISITVDDPRTFTEGGVANSSDINAEGALAYKTHEIKGNASSVDNSEKESNSPPCKFSEFKENSNLSENMDLWHVYKDVHPPVDESLLCTKRHNQRMELFGLDNRISGAFNTPDNVQHSRCPILLIKNYRQKSFMRWSIILPLSWVKVIWMSLISNGAHAIGLREKHWVACEAGLPYFPFDFPDCNSYACLMEMDEAAADESARRTPLSSRPFRVPILSPWNSVHLALDKRSPTERSFPLHCKDLCTKEFKQRSFDDFTGCGEHLHATTPFEGFIARTSHILSRFLNQINGSHLLLFPKFSNGEKNIFTVIKDKMWNEHSDMVISPVNYGPKLCFVRVLLRAYRKGVFEGGAVVCAPHADEILLLTQRSECSDGELQITESSVRSYFARQDDGKWECQIPTDPVTEDSYRPPIGFVTTGSILGSKKPVAVALCEAINLACLREDQWRVASLKRRKEIYVLVRNLRSTTFRLATANIILEQSEDDDIDYM